MAQSWPMNLRGSLLGWDGSSWKDFLSSKKGRQSLCCSPRFCCIWIETLELQQHSFLGLRLKSEPGSWVLHHGICINQSILLPDFLFSDIFPYFFKGNLCQDLILASETIFHGEVSLTFLKMMKERKPVSRDKYNF